MGKKTVYERFIWFDKKARSGGYPNATTLAERFEVSRKTAQRDIEFIRDRISAPLDYDASKKGYFYKDNTFTLPSIFLSTDEISSLLIAKKVLRDISGGNLSRELSSIINKLTACLDYYSSDKLNIENVISLKHIEYLPVRDHVFKTVLEGCLRGKCLSLRYQATSENAVRLRVVDPYHIFNYRGTWHILAYCHKRKNIRDFALGRITSVNLLNDDFKIIKNFNPNDYLSSAFGLYRGGRTYRIRLKFSPQASGWIGGKIWHEGQKIKTQKDGSILLSFTAAGLTEVKSEVLKYGSLVEVLAPTRLREIVQKEAKAIVRVYKK